MLVGWPVISPQPAGGRRPLDDLRRTMTQAGVLHRYHRALSDAEDDFHLVVGYCAGGSAACVQAAVDLVRQYLARQPVEITLGMDPVRIKADDSPTLAARLFSARLPVAAAKIAALYR